MFATARRYSSNASRRLDIGARGLRARQRRPVRLGRRPARSKWSEAWISECALEQPAELAGPRVEPAELRRRDDAVQRVAQQLMAEVVEARDRGTSNGYRNACSTSSANGASRSATGRSMTPASDLRDEAPTDDRAGACDRPRASRRQAGEAGQDRVLDRVGDVRRRGSARPSVRASSPSAAEQLLDVQRDAVGALVDGVDDLARSRQAGVEDERRHSAVWS